MRREVKFFGHRISADVCNTAPMSFNVHRLNPTMDTAISIRRAGHVLNIIDSKKFDSIFSEQKTTAQKYREI